MKIVTDKDHPPARGPEGLYVTLGNFDGFHLGHRSVVAELLSACRAGDGEATAITFEPHPAEVLDTVDAPGLLSPGAERSELMAESGLPELRIVTFTRETARMDARLFLASMAVGGGSHLVLGYDFHMGRGRAADLEGLAALGREMGFGLDVVPPVLWRGEPISSTRIRKALEAGEVEAAREMLGRPYEIRGEVVRGDGVGKGLGYATANLEPTSRKLLPADGVYLAVAAPGGGAVLPALVYVGTRPSVGGGPRRVETHILDRRDDLYGTELSVGLLDFLRPDRAFSTTDELRDQIGEDVARARREAGTRWRGVFSL